MNDSNAENKKDIIIFFNYFEGDKQKVYKYHFLLSMEGYKPWMYDYDILPGEDIEEARNHHLEKSDFFIAFISQSSIKQDGQHIKEIRRALDIAKEKLPNDIYFIPALIEECDIPSFLRKYQPVSIFKSDEIEKLYNALREGIKRRKNEN